MDLHGLVREINENEILVTNKFGENFNFILEEPWLPFVDYLSEMDLVYIKSETERIDGRGKFIIEPYYQVPVTRAIEAINCPRKIYVKHMGAEFLDDDRFIMKRITQGRLLHNLFTQQITQPVEIHQAIEDSVEKSKIDLITADMGEKEARKYLQNNGMLLKTFSIEGKSEVDVQNWKYGLHGKFDALTENMIIELKSSNIPEGTPWPSHNFQLNAYLGLLEDIGEYKGKVLYLKDGNMQLLDPTHLSINDILVGRNWTYLVLSGKFLPPILRGSDKKTCRNCYVKEGCYNLCAGLKTQRDCEECFHELVCNKQVWDESTLAYHSRLIQALDAEELELKKEEFNRSAYISGKDNIRTGIERGEVILTTEKLDEELKDGYYLTLFSHKSVMPKFRRGDYGAALNLEQSVPSTTMYENIIVVSINETELVSQSLNALPSSCLIVSSNSSTLVQRGRRAIYQTAVHGGNILKLIRNSLVKEFELDNFEYNTKKISNPLIEYNAEQVEAILHGINTPDLSLIQGPAGTGKTSVLIEMVNQLTRQGKKVLCSAFTNMAVDNIGTKLKNAGIEFIRLGNKHSVLGELRDHTVEFKQEEFKKLLNEKEAGVILSTTTTIGNPKFDGLFFDYVILDEAAQMLETDTLQPLLHGEKGVLIGDHQQLQPIVISRKAQELELDISMFERLVKRFPERHILLKEQYRMSDEILHFPNKTFYDGELRSANEEIGSQRLDVLGEILDPKYSFQLLSVTSEEMHNAQINYQEAFFVGKIVQELLKSKQVNEKDIGIIVPFRAQVRLLRDLLPGLDIDTVDRFQGSEREIIIFSSVTVADVPIVADPRRTNVALTRAKKKLIVLLSNIELQKPAPVLEALYRDATDRDILTQVHAPENIRENLTKLGESVGSYLRRTTTFRPEIHPYPSYDVMTNIYYNSVELTVVEFNDPLRICSICWQDVRKGVECPGCSYQFHKNHLQIWVERKSYCPICKHTLVER